MLKISANRRHIIREDGTPFFYLADTAWELFHRLDREEAAYYLETRALQGYTAIQAVVLAEHEYDRPNPYNHFPLWENDPTQPNEHYFEHVDFIVNKAASLGLIVAMLPTWGDKWNKAWGVGPEIFTPENAKIYGEFLGKRYRNSPIIWVLGGDRPISNESHKAIIRSMAAGLKAGDGAKHLMTYHPPGGATSAEHFHNDDWLDFNMWQTGHKRDVHNGPKIAGDYKLLPIKPVLDAEPGYENHVSNFRYSEGFMNAYDVRKFAYWAIFAGACGHTYGCHEMWAFWSPKWAVVNLQHTVWHEAIHLPGGNQMQFARHLIESRPMLNRIPDNSFVLSPEQNPRIVSTRAEDGSFAMVFLPEGGTIKVDARKLTGKSIVAHWYDTRIGKARNAGEFERDSLPEFRAPDRSDAPDWVLVLDDASKNFRAPGKL